MDMDYDELEPGLYQGARPTQAPTFADAIINLERTIHIDYPHMHDTFSGYLWVPIEDSPTTLPDLDWLNMVIDTLVLWRKLRWKVFVHCTAGISRSSLITVGYFMKTRDKSWYTALLLVQAKRKDAHPNLGFCKLLEQYGEQLRAKKFPPLGE